MAKKTPDRPGPSKPPKGGSGASHSPQNERLTEQTRKQLGKHYANKYRPGRG